MILLLIHSVSFNVVYTYTILAAQDLKYTYRSGTQNAEKYRNKSWMGCVLLYPSYLSRPPGQTSWNWRGGGCIRHLWEVGQVPPGTFCGMCEQILDMWQLIMPDDCSTFMKPLSILMRFLPVWVHQSLSLGN